MNSSDVVVDSKTEEFPVAAKDQVKLIVSTESMEIDEPVMKSSDHEQPKQECDVKPKQVENISAEDNPAKKPSQEKKAVEKSDGSDKYEYIGNVWTFEPQLSSFTAVDSVRQKETGKLFIRKRIAIQYITGENWTREPVRMEYEFNDLLHLKEKSLVHILEVIQGTVDHCSFFIMEVAEGRTLKEWVEHQSVVFLDPARKFWNGVLDGLQYLHKNHVAHLDIHPETILVTAHNKPKFVDLGFALPTIKDNWPCLHMTTGRASEMMAPEVYEEKVFKAPAADVWSAVVLLIFILDGKYPWKKPHRDCLAFYEWSTFGTQPWSFLNINSQVQDLVEKSLLDDPDLRPEICDLLQHDFVVNKGAEEERRKKMIEEEAFRRDIEGLGILAIHKEEEMGNKNDQEDDDEEEGDKEEIEADQDLEKEAMAKQQKQISNITCNKFMN